MKSPSIGRSSESLSKEKRLTKRAEFLRFFENAERAGAGECWVFRIDNEKGFARLGITLKARGSSVARNRVKRLIREAFRRQQESLGSYDYNVVIPRSKTISHPYPQHLKRALQRVFNERNPKIWKTKLPSERIATLRSSAGTRRA